MAPSVRVLAVDLDVPAGTVAAFAASLPAAECDVRPRARVLRAITRQALSETLRTDPAGLRICRRCARCGHESHGKPQVVDAPQTSFSVSHAAGIGVIAIAHGDDTVVGIDIEHVQRRRNLAVLAARVLGPEEYAAFLATPPPSQLMHFLKVWTAKEAYLKAIGTGVIRRLADVSPEPAGWVMVPLSAPLGFVGTLALGGRVGLNANGGTAG
jgi:4'-phosphopantetheinyl transferase